ncbi:MAG: hypothetical protein K6G22_12995 [Lachnospiraceae bacterium]|nr:hypothetical protein [Lachnospiraceae bacterium]
MLNDKLDRLMTKLDATNTDIAKIAGVDRTNLSRFRSGKRIPRQDSEITDCLISAIYDYATAEKKLKTLYRMIRCDSTADRNTVCRNLRIWLYSDTPDEYFIRKTGSSRSSLSFSDRFDRAMILADITNSGLGKLVHVDSSLISHYRTGIRTPQSNPALASSISDALYEHIIKADGIVKLAGLMRIKPDMISREAFHEWLCSFDQDEDGGSTAMKLLEAFDSYQSDNMIKLPEFEDVVSKEILTDERMIYNGSSGLREAVLRFLVRVAESDAAEMMLYSDQDMGWMMADNDFTLRWAALMSSCVKKGKSLHIIHNIDRNLDEMSQAITSWLPLYMSGMIRSYYHTKKVGERFAHTLFLCPKVACISGCNAGAAEHEGRYYYFTADSDLDYCRKEYEALMKHTRPLIRMEPYKPDKMPGNGIKVLDGSGYETSTSTSPYKNMGVIIGSDSVRIIRTKKPYLSFTVTHPLMRKAFLAYAERLNS